MFSQITSMWNLGERWLQLSSYRAATTDINAIPTLQPVTLTSGYFFSQQAGLIIIIHETKF